LGSGTEVTPNGLASLTLSPSARFSALPLESEVVVIGGGAVGLLTALSLRESGCDVTVLERRSFLSEASGVNAGTLSVQNKLSSLVPYTLAALDEWQTLAARLGADVGFKQPGGYNVATTDEERATLRRTAEIQASLGVSVRWMERPQLAETAPWLGEDVLAATYSPQDGFANPLALGNALSRKLRACNVRLVEGAAVEGITESSSVDVLTTKGTVRADQVLIASGVWSGQIAALAGVELPIKLDVNMLSVTEPCDDLIPNVVCHARGILTMKQTSNGTCLIGGGWQGAGTLQDESKDVDYESILHNVRLAARIVPGLRSAHIVRQWSGYEGVTPDSMPYVGRLPGSSRVYIAACARGGFTLSPILAQLASAQMRGKTPALPTQAFGPERHANA
jgi:glycine/D-amino acid oxidase-like deaminating enzyme